MWVNGRDRASVVATYAEAALRLGVPAGDPIAAADHFLRGLATTERRWLVILDDAVRPADLDGLWPPANPTGRVVVTSDGTGDAWAGRGRVVALDRYTPDEALEYLTGALIPPPEPAFPDRADGLINPVTAVDRVRGAASLAGRLRYLPIAITHAAAYLTPQFGLPDTGLDCAGYQGMVEGRGPAAGDDAAVLAVTTALALEQADRLDQRGVPTPLLGLLSVLDPAGVPIAVLATTAVTEYLSTAVAGDAVVTGERVLAAFACARLQGLAAGAGAGDAAVVQVHGLVQAAVRARTADWGPVIRAAAAGLLQAWPETDDDAALAMALRANVAALRRHGEDELWSTGDPELLFRCGQSWQEAGLTGAAVTYYQELADEARARLGPEHPSTVLAELRLARAYRMAGRTDVALPLAQRVLADAERRPRPRGSVHIGGP